MQTFLPYPDFRACAETLDRRRLGKQRVEAMQILNTIADPTRRGWQNHPAVRMWRGYEDALRLYMNTMIEEWVRRGYRNTMALAPIPADVCMPPWLGNLAFHASHRSNLLRKDPEFYARHGWSEPADLPYVWPTDTLAEATLAEQGLPDVGFPAPDPPNAAVGSLHTSDAARDTLAGTGAR